MGKPVHGVKQAPEHGPDRADLDIAVRTPLQLDPEPEFLSRWDFLTALAGPSLLNLNASWLLRNVHLNRDSPACETTRAAL